MSHQLNHTVKIKSVDKFLFVLKKQKTKVRQNATVKKRDKSGPAFLQSAWILTFCDLLHMSEIQMLSIIGHFAKVRVRVSRSAAHLMTKDFLFLEAGLKCNYF